eukprot:3074233-Amphidinium_carterae.4
MKEYLDALSGVDNAADLQQYETGLEDWKVQMDCLTGALKVATRDIVKEKTRREGDLRKSALQEGKCHNKELQKKVQERLQLEEQREQFERESKLFRLAMTAHLPMPTMTVMNAEQQSYALPWTFQLAQADMDIIAQDDALKRTGGLWKAAFPVTPEARKSAHVASALTDVGAFRIGIPLCMCVTPKVSEPLMQRGLEASNIVGYTEKYIHFGREPMNMQTFYCLAEGSMKVVVGFLSELAPIAAKQVPEGSSFV